MNLVYRQRRTLAIVIGALAASAVVATTRGSGQTAMLVALVVALLAAYLVRHQVRARLLYKRQMDAPGAPGHPLPALDQPSQPGTTTTRGD